jgi:hypothetical protein
MFDVCYKTYSILKALIFTISFAAKAYHIVIINHHSPMRKFLQAAFKITPFQIFSIALLAGLKYLINTYKFLDKTDILFVWIFIGAG